MDLLRPLVPGDAAACVRVSSSRGWPHGEAEWRMVLEQGEGLGVELDGRLEGTVVLTRFGGALATISMMVVTPGLGRTGLGTRLLAASLEAAGAATVLLYATEMGHGLYLRHGFVEAGATVRLLGPFTGRPPRRTDVRHLRRTDHAAVLALDEAAHGAPRRGLLAWHLDAADTGLVAERDGEVVGYGLAREAMGRRILGPVAAVDEDAAIGLCSALASGASLPVQVDVAPGERGLLAWGRAAGLALAETRALMVREGRPLPGRRELIRALASRAHG
jgi:predicted N-acetyltransferase YhbS